MQKEKVKIDDIDHYISDFPKDTQKLLVQLRGAIRKIVPEAKEKMSYGIPTFTINGNLVHYAGYKNHIGFYPGASGIKTFKKEIDAYKNAKGSVQFPIDKPLPITLINKIVKFRLKENLEKLNKKDIGKVSNFMDSLSTPVRRALQNIGIKSLKQLSKYSEDEIMQLHGMGPSSLPKLKNALEKNGLIFRKSKL